MELALKEGNLPHTTPISKTGQELESRGSVGPEVDLGSYTLSPEVAAASFHVQTT